MSAKKLVELIAAASAAGTAAASDWESGSDISIDNHRLRSLMDFDRTVAHPTSGDIDGLPQWRAFLEAYDKEARPGCINTDANPGGAVKPVAIDTKQLEGRLFEIEEVSLTMQEILLADFQPEHTVCALTALRKQLHKHFEDCIELLHGEKLE